MRAQMPVGFYNGLPVKIVSNGYFKQKKNSKYKLLNWLLKLLFGYEFVYNIKDGEMIKIGNSLLMNPNTYEELKKGGVEE